MSTQPRLLKDEVYGMGGRLLDLLFPPRCVNCKKSTGALCANCLHSVEYIQAPICERCGDAVADISAPCFNCRTHPLTISHIRAAAWHEGVVREGLHALKYGNRRDTVPLLAEMIAARMGRSKYSFDVITPVPLHATRLAERGYNQAELLARETARLVRVPIAPLLVRTRATADQVGLSGPDRRTNVEGAFQARGASLAGKSIVLIDDVCTTGATLDACAQALFQNGARTVYGLTVARPR